MKSATAGTTMVSTTVGTTMVGTTMVSTTMAGTMMAGTTMAGTTMASTGAYVYPNEATHPDCYSFLAFLQRCPPCPWFVRISVLGNRRVGKHNAFNIQGNVM
jgi:hypothetical protein